MSQSMDRDEILEYLTNQVDLLQRKAVELSEQHDAIEKELKSYKQLIRMYRGVYESEAGVGLQNRLPAQIMEILEEKQMLKLCFIQEKVFIVKTPGEHIQA